MDFGEYLKPRKDELVEQLQGLIRIKSVEEPDGDYPFGEGVHACLLYCLHLSDQLGFRVINYDNMTGYAEFGEGDEMVAVLAHVDVVPEGEGWTYPPYAGVIANGKLYGRGAIDNKGPAIAALYALKAVADSGVKLERRVRVFFGLNEETGSLGIRHYVESGGELPVMGFTPDSEYPIINGEKGIVNCVFSRRLPKEEGIILRSLHGGVAGNVVPDAAFAELACDAEKGLRLARKLVDLEGITCEAVADGLLIHAKGKNAHGSVPQQGVNAISRLILALDAVSLSGSHGETIAYLARGIAADTDGRALGINLADDVSGELTLNLGVAEFDGERLKLRLNLRYPVKRSFEECYPKLRESMLQHGFEEETLTHKHSIYYSADSELVRRLARVYEEHTGEKATLISSGGGTYAKAMPGVVAFGPIFPGEEKTEHQPDEYVCLDSLMKTAGIIASAIHALATDIII